MLPKKSEKINSELKTKHGNEIHLIIKDNVGPVLWTRSTLKLCPHFQLLNFHCERGIRVYDKDKKVKRKKHH